MDLLLCLLSMFLADFFWLRYLFSIVNGRYVALVFVILISVPVLSFISGGIGYNIGFYLFPKHRFDVTTTSSSAPKEEKIDTTPTKDEIARAEVLLSVVESFKGSNKQIEYDGSIHRFVTDIKWNMYYDAYELNFACDCLEQDLLRYKTTVATTTEGYTWLKSMGAI